MPSASVFVGRPGAISSIFCLDPVDDRQRVLAVAHDDHAAHRLDAGLVERAAAELRAQAHRGHVLDEERRALPARMTMFSRSAGALDEADAADEELDAVDLDDLGADVDVGALRPPP